MGPTGLTTVQAFCRYAPSGLAKLEPGQGALLPAVWESLSGMAGWSMQAGILRGAGGRFCRCRFAPAPRALLRVTALLLSPVLPAAAAGSSFAVEDMLPLSYVLLAAGFIAVLLTIRHLMRRSGRSSGTSFAMPRTSLGKRRLAQQLIGQRRYREAGDLFLEAGQRSAALDAYLQGGASDRAARLLESQGDLEGAARSYEAAGGHADAARLWLRLGQPSLAARNHEEAGQLTEAARLWTVAGEHLQAAEVLRRKGDLREAARSYQRAGLIEQTAEVYRQILDQLCGDGPSSADPQELAETARLTGRMFESLQQSQKAVEAYLRGGLPQEAIRVLVGAGRHNEAARILLDLGKLDRAIELFEQGGEKELAIRLKAKQARAAGDPAAAAELLLQVGERREAADLLSQARRFAEASRLYLELGDAQAAAYCCESDGDLPGAAAAHEQGGNLHRAAELYRRLGKVEDELRMLHQLGEKLAAARIMLERGDEAAAVEVLKGISRESSDYRPSCLLLGDIYARRDDPEAASIKYRHALKDQRPGTSNLAEFYKLAQAAEAAGQQQLALATLAAIVEVDPSYEDCRQRIERLKKPQVLELTEVVDDDAEQARQATLVKPPPVLDAPPDQTPTGTPRYRLLEPIGRGGLCEVFRARDTLLEREVAYKSFATIHLVGASPDLFLKEARTAAKLNHPNVVTIFDAGIEQRTPYIAMELVDGDNLSTMVDKLGPLGLRFICSVLRQSCEVLAYAHERGVVHRDVKPANMMWTKEGALKITDFGLARFLDGSTQEAQSQIMGTPFYMSPEQILGEVVDQRTDIYSLGVTLFQLTCGRVPFHEGRIIEQHLKAAPPRPSSLRQDCPAWLEHAILWCMEKDRQRRPASAKDLWRSVEKPIGQITLLATRPPRSLPG